MPSTPAKDDPKLPLKGIGSDSELHKDIVLLLFCFVTDLVGDIV
jgi:hypothetical protein